MPASGPRLGREPAASEGSGICPGIMSDPATTAAVGRERDKEEKEGLEREKENFLTVTKIILFCKTCSKQVCDLKQPGS